MDAAQRPRPAVAGGSNRHFLADRIVTDDCDLVTFCLQCCAISNLQLPQARRTKWKAQVRHTVSSTKSKSQLADPRSEPPAPLPYVHPTCLQKQNEDNHTLTLRLWVVVRDLRRRSVNGDLFGGQFSSEVWCQAWCACGARVFLPFFVPPCGVHSSERKFNALI